MVLARDASDTFTHWFAEHLFSVGVFVYISVVVVNFSQLHDCEIQVKGVFSFIHILWSILWYIIL